MLYEMTNESGAIAESVCQSVSCEEANNSPDVHKIKVQMWIEFLYSKSSDKTLLRYHYFVIGVLYLNTEHKSEEPCTVLVIEDLVCLLAYKHNYLT